jgi:predicted ferric reductase
MRRPLLLGALAGALVLALALSVARRAGLVEATIPLPAGQGAWLASRAAALTAYLALTIEMALGLFLSTGLADRWIARARSVELHRWLSIASLALIAGHAGALLADRVVPFDLLDVSIPFLAPYRRLAVGLGVAAGWLVLALHASFALRSRLGPRLWRSLHFASFAVYVMATVHGVLAGTDARQGAPRALYLGSGALVGLLLLWRILASVARRGPSTSSVTTGSHGADTLRA